LQIGWHYFELQPGGAAWTDLASSRSLGLYVAGDWPGLMLRGWVIRAPLPEPTYGG
jgi:type VI secretion system protein ImpJ